jgi:hypothetical protein
MSRIRKTRVGFIETVGGFLTERSLAFGAKISLRAVVVALGVDGSQFAAGGTVFFPQGFGVEFEFRSSVVRHDLDSMFYVIKDIITYIMKWARALFRSLATCGGKHPASPVAGICRDAQPEARAS